MKLVEECIIHFLKDYAHACIRLRGKRPIPDRVDDPVFCALLLIAEHRELVVEKDSVLAAIDKALSACRTFGDKQDSIKTAWLAHFQQYEELPLQLGKAILNGEPKLSESVCTLLRGIRHRQSSLRLHMYEIAWFIRGHLPTEETSGALFENAACTLGYHKEALGLAASLFLSDEEFFYEASGHLDSFDEYDEQFEHRLENAKTSGRLSKYQHGFLLRENDIRRRIEEVLVKRLAAI